MAKKAFGEFAIHDPVMNFAGGGETARVDIYGAIGWDVWADEFLRNLRELPDAVDTLDVRIHSMGGSVLDGWAIANALKAHKAEVIGTVEGTAASMASVIALACDRLRMPENAYLMIHRVSGGGFGNPDEMDSAARLARQLESDIVKFYASRTGIDEEEIREMMAKETWMNGIEAKEAGFCDVVIDAVEVAAFAGGSVVNAFAGFPDEVLKALGIEEGSSEEETGNSSEEEKAEASEEVEETPEETPDETPDETSDETSGDDEGEETPGDAPGEDPEEKGEKETVNRSLLAFVKNLMGGDRDGGGQNFAALTAENARLLGQIENLTGERDAAVMERDEFASKVSVMEAEQREVWAVIAECGFTAAESADLPGPDEGEGGERPEGSAFDRWNAMAPGPEKRAFFKAHRDEIVSAYDSQS